ncbi:MAG: glycoside hydrolase family 13 protein [Lachnospiraceae bacterium]|nr:glycoside hydrolase family 13 protein [Lachnospiraceae bacterium]
MDIKFNYRDLSKLEKFDLYIDNMTKIFQSDSVFSDGTERFRCPAEPMPGDRVKLAIRTARDNVDKVILVINDERIEMEIGESDMFFDYYEAYVDVGEENMYYYYEIVSNTLQCYYTRRGVSKTAEKEFYFTLMPGFVTPDWAKGAVFYQIFVDRFYNGDRSNDVETNEYIYINEGTVRVNDITKYPSAMDVREFYGGDLKGVMEKLDYLKDLGVDVIYLNPIFVSPSNHKYDIQDYDYVDPHYGVIIDDGGEVLEDGATSNEHATKYIRRVTNKRNLEASNELFIRLVDAIHERGMKVILDGVFNHCGSFNKWLDREKIYSGQEGYPNGAYVDERSPYHTYFRFLNSLQWPDNNSYEGWWGHDTLPKLNYEESYELFQEIMRIGRKWVSPPYNADGWRLDVAADLGFSVDYNHFFWKKFRENVKNANPNAIILAEHYGDPSSWLSGDQWDTIMNYDAFMEPISWFLTGLEKHSDEFRGDLLGNGKAFKETMIYNMAKMNTQSLQVSMNELSNHDHSRFLTRTNRRVGRLATLGPVAAEENINKAVFMLGVVIQMTWPGAPTVYYGDEAGLCGWTDPDNRRAYPWGREDERLLQFHKEIISIHKDYDALKKGSLKFLAADQDLLAYGRFLGEEKIIVVINSATEDRPVKLFLRGMGIDDMEMVLKLMETADGQFSRKTRSYDVRSGYIHMDMRPQSSVILKVFNR